MDQVLVRVDGSNTSVVALHWAVRLASQASAAITVLVAERRPSVLRSRGAQELGAFSMRLCERVGVSASVSVAADDPRSQLIELADSVDAGIVVVGADPRSRIASGRSPDVNDELVERVDRPVVLIPPAARPGLRRVILGIGRSSTSGAAIEMATNLARLFDADVVAVHALCPSPPTDDTHDANDGAQRSIGDWSDARRMLTSVWTAPLRDAGVLAGARIVDGSDVPSALRRVSRQLGGDLTVIGRRPSAATEPARDGVSRPTADGLWGPLLQVPAATPGPGNATTAGAWRQSKCPPRV